MSFPILLDVFRDLGGVFLCRFKSVLEVVGIGVVHHASFFGLLLCIGLTLA